MFSATLRGLLACSIFALTQRPLLVSAQAPKSPPAIAVAGTTEWTGWGGNVYNNRWASSNRQINSSTLGDLEQHCKLDYPTGVSATPVALNNTVYYPTSNGSFYALNYATCEYRWQINVEKLIIDTKPLTDLQVNLNNSLPMSRTSPQIDVGAGILYFGTQAQALLVAVDLFTGKTLGTIAVHDHPLAIITMSPTVYKGNVFVGVSSQESSASRDESYQCCDFVGKIASYKFDRKSGKFTERWSHDTLPVGKGWSGAASWGSQPPIDPDRNQVFFATGNTYVYPEEYIHCINETSACLPDDVWQESVIAVDIDSGKVNWRKSMSPLDGWVMICGFAGAPTSDSPLCPERPGPDADFGMAPAFVPAALGSGTTGKDSLVIGQKSGNMYSLNAETGELDWSIVTAAKDGIVGGPGAMSWGLAADDKNAYYTAINFGARNWTIQPDGPQINNSAFGAASLKTGELLWTVPCPDFQLSYTPPAIANDVMFVGQSGSKAVTNDATGQTTGAVLALSKNDGAILQKWPVESIQRGGVLVSGGFVMFGSGYHYQNPFNAGSFYVYGLPDAIEAAKVQPVIAAPSASPATGGEDGSETEDGAEPSSTKKSAAARFGANSAIMNVIYPVAMMMLTAALLS